jgi:hypothetical protein
LIMDQCPHSRNIQLDHPVQQCFPVIHLNKPVLLRFLFYEYYSYSIRTHKSVLISIKSRFGKCYLIMYEYE